MSDQVVDVEKIGKVYGDRLLVRRLGEPEKKRGIYVPASMLAGKKEPRKVWWGEVVIFGEDSKVAEDSKVVVGDVVGLEPLGNHYAGFKGTDGHAYVWVPDEHVCMADAGSVADFYADRLDRREPPRLRVLGDRTLLRPVSDDELFGKGRLHRPDYADDRETKVADVVMLGPDATGVVVGDRVVHVAEDSGSSAQVDIFEPSLVVLRAADLIATLTPAPAAVPEVAGA